MSDSFQTAAVKVRSRPNVVSDLARNQHTEQRHEKSQPRSFWNSRWACRLVIHGQSLGCDEQPNWIALLLRTFSLFGWPVKSIVVGWPLRSYTHAALVVLFNRTVAMLLFSIAEAGTEGLAPAFTGASS